MTENPKAAVGELQLQASERFRQDPVKQSVPLARCPVNGCKEARARNCGIGPQGVT